MIPIAFSAWTTDLIVSVSTIRRRVEHYVAAAGEIATTDRLLRRAIDSGLVVSKDGASQRAWEVTRMQLDTTRHSLKGNPESERIVALETAQLGGILQTLDSIHAARGAASNAELLQRSDYGLQSL